MRKWIKNVGLILSGLVLGVGVSFAGDISAATSKLLGGKVGKVMTVSLDNKSIGEAPVIGGTSYVPVRAAANELGLEINVSGNEIELTTPEEATEPVVTSPVEQPATEEPVVAPNSEGVNKLNQEIESVKRYLQTAEKNMEFSKKQLVDFTTAAKADPSGKTALWDMVESMEADVKTSQETMDKLKTELADLEAQLAALK